MTDEAGPAGGKGGLLFLAKDLIMISWLDHFELGEDLLTHFRADHPDARKQDCPVYAETVFLHCWCPCKDWPRAERLKRMFFHDTDGMPTKEDIANLLVELNERGCGGDSTSQYGFCTTMDEYERNHRVDASARDKEKWAPSDTEPDDELDSF